MYIKTCVIFCNTFIKLETLLAQKRFDFTPQTLVNAHSFCSTWSSYANKVFNVVSNVQNVDSP